MTRACRIRLTFAGNVAAGLALAAAGWVARDYVCRRVLFHHDVEILYDRDNYRAVVQILCAPGNDPGAPATWLGAVVDGRIDRDLFDKCAAAWKIAAAKK